MEARKGSVIQIVISPEMDDKLLQYQGMHMIEHNRRISKTAVTLKALEEFLHYNVDGFIEIKKDIDGK